MRSDIPALLIIGLSTTFASAEIYRWNDGQLIPGTEGITPGPGVQLDHRELQYAGLYGLNLTGANFEQSNLMAATLGESDLTGANLNGANLSTAQLTSAILANADLTGSIVGGANLSRTTERGFTQEQL